MGTRYRLVIYESYKFLVIRFALQDDLYNKKDNYHHNGYNGFFMDKLLRILRSKDTHNGYSFITSP